MIEPSTADNVLQLLECESKSIIPQLFQNWIEIGYDKKTVTKFGSEVVAHHKNLLEEMLIETQSRRTRLFQDIEALVEKISVLSKELKKEVDLDYKNEPLVEVESKLRAELKNFQTIKEERLTKYKQLLEKEHEICQVLGTKAIGIDTSLPSEKEIKNYQTRLTEQEEEIIKLKQIFQRIQTEILEMIAELSYEPSDDFEKIVCNDYDNFIYSVNNMTKLREFRDRLHGEIEALKELADKKRQELIKLWDYLNVTQDECNKFLNEYPGFDTATITALNKEIKHCKDIRKANMEKYVGEIRQEIIKWWDKCRIGQVERDDFRPFNYETCNEDTLTIHEIEVEKLRRYYEENEKIFEMLNQESEMWIKLKELMLREDDPNRFNNRGGQLLEEEKQRKLINKALPKISEQLIQLLSQYEQENGKQFLIDGVSYEDYRASQIQQFNEEKENIKVARARAKDEKKSAKKTPLSASRRNLTQMTTLRNARTSVKRKIDLSPVLCTSKKRMINSEKARTLVARARRSGQHHVSRKLLSSSFNSSKNSARKKTPIKPSMKLNEPEDLPHYEEFQNGLANRDELRSTLVSGELIKPKSTKNIKTPVKTPAKPLRKRPGLLSTPGTPRTSKNPVLGSTPRLTALRGEYKF